MANLADRLGCNAHLAGLPNMRLLHALGVKYCRIDGLWSMVQEHGPTDWQWRWLDESIDAAVSLGLEPYVCWGKTPGWASRTGHASGPPISVIDWTNFVRAAGLRYQGKVRLHGGYNEPNSEAYWTGIMEEYVDWIIKPMAATLRAIDPNNRIAIPDITTEDSWPTWLETCLRRAEGFYDIVTTHAYAKDGLAVWRMLTQAPKWYELWKKPSVQQVIQKAGAGDKPWWVTEVGWNTAEVSEAHQADSLQQLLEKLEQASKPDGILYFDLRDEGHAWGLYREDGLPKAAAAVLQRHCGLLVG